MPNVELLRKTLAHIEAHPEQWDQTQWSNDCGTAYCFAGWAAVLSGAEFEEDSESVCPPHSTMTEHVEAYAARILDLDFGHYEDSTGELVAFGVELFDSHNTLDDLRRIVGKLCEVTS